MGKKNIEMYVAAKASAAEASFLFPRNIFSQFFDNIYCRSDIS